MQVPYGLFLLIYLKKWPSLPCITGVADLCLQRKVLLLECTFILSRVPFFLFFIFYFEKPYEDEGDMQEPFFLHKNCKKDEW